MKKSSAWCMLVPGLVILFLFLMIPLLRVLVPSVFTGDYPFSAYVDFFKDEYYRKIFLRTVKIAVITTFVCMVGGIPTAYFISRCDKKWRGLLLSASIFPMMTNSVIRSFAWINILGSNGIINKAMIAMGLIGKPMKLLYTDFSIIIGSVYLFLPLMIVTVAGVLENIDDDMMEAAQSLGCPKGAAFFKVVLPNVTSGISSAFMLAFINSFNNIPVSMFLSGPGVSTFPSTLMNYIEYNYDPTVSAVSVLLMAATVVIMVIVDRTLGIAALAK